MLSFVQDKPPPPCEGVFPERTHRCRAGYVFHSADRCPRATLSVVVSGMQEQDDKEIRRVREMKGDSFKYI